MNHKKINNHLNQISDYMQFCPCFLLQDGGRGHLEGLASVYCELLLAPFGEVLLALEEARQRAWSDRSPKHSSGMNKGHRGSCNQLDSLPNSHSQPIYVPGKYSVRYKWLAKIAICCFNVHPSYSHRVVSRTRRKMRFMVSVMGCLPRGSGASYSNQSKVKCHSKIPFQIVLPMYLQRNSNKGNLRHFLEAECARF